MDAREAFGDHCSHTQVLGSERSILSGGSLPVIVPTHNEPASPLDRAGGEMRVDAPEDEFGHRGDVRAKGHYLCSIRRKVPGGDVIAHHDQHAAFESFGKWASINA